MWLSLRKKGKFGLDKGGNRINIKDNIFVGNISPNFIGLISNQKLEIFI